MRTGIAALIAALVSIGGCDRDLARPLAPQAKPDESRNPPSSVRYRLDPARNRMWVLTRDGVFVYDARTPKTIVEVALPSWQSMDEPYSCPPDLALGPRGEAVVTSNAVPTLWKIDPDSLAVTVHELKLDADQNKDVGFSTLAYSAQHGAFLAVSDMHGSLWRIDRSLREGRKLAQVTAVSDQCRLTSASF